MTATPAALSELDPATLLNDPAAFETTLDDAAGPIAVVGAPFAGRSRVLDHAERILDATRTRFEPSPDPEMLVTVELAVAPEADLDAALKIMEQALITSAYVYVDGSHPVTARIDDDVSYRTVRGRAYVSDHRHEQAFRSEVTRRALAAFEARGMETPEYPLIHEFSSGTDQPA